MQTIDSAKRATVASPVLIIGNGISRLSYKREIAKFPGELWATNRAYLEPDLGPRLSRLTGHREVLVEARYRAEVLGLRCEYWAGHLSRQAFPWAKVFTCPSLFLRDSGTTLVAQALFEGRKVSVVGFDLGGPDLHSPGLWRQCKRGWVDRWVQIFRQWGPDCVEWIGHDHAPFIRAVAAKKASARDYGRRYLRKMPHIPGRAYLRVWSQYFSATKEQVAAAARGEEVKLKVRYRNGRETELREDVAKIFAARGRVVILSPIADSVAAPAQARVADALAKPARVSHRRAVGESVPDAE